MKRLVALFALLPGLATAHGLHAPVEPMLHGFAHLTPGLIVLAMVAVLALLWTLRE